MKRPILGHEHGDGSVTSEQRLEPRDVGVRAELAQVQTPRRVQDALYRGHCNEARASLTVYRRSLVCRIQGLWGHNTWKFSP